ncbi:MAG TPA: hypothetical protein DCQ31_16720 [Bacteroidales bacterium]|nr:hypothetical protein [Bacteroidales bacterium]
MKRHWLFISILFVSTVMKAQFDIVPVEPEKRTAVNIGLLFGGGAMVGADLEFLVSPKFGVQIGAGYIGYGAGLNYHPKPGIRTSYLSLQYWNQGTGSTLTNRSIGANFVYRGKKWFAGQIGLAKTLEKGPAWPSTMQYPPVMLTYALGFYLPL